MSGCPHQFRRASILVVLFCLWACDGFRQPLYGNVEIIFGGGTSPLTYIYQQSTDKTVAQGGTTFLWVDAHTDVRGASLTYRWYKDGTNPVGEDSGWLFFTNARLSDAGLYQASVSNEYGFAVSSVMRLTVVPPPLLSQPLQPVATSYFSNATFTVQASGTGPFTYQWLFQGTSITGATNSSLILSNLVRSNQGAYSVVVSNFAGAVTSSPAALRVWIPLRIRPPVPTGDGRLRMQFGDGAGDGLTTSDLANFEFHVSHNLLSTNWVPLTNQITLTNGHLMFYEPSAGAITSRFYRIIER
ncbi:MAG: hypothetical protein EBS05_18285 [Proteobacteria bacterium]|jgi:hypothetical protein|nr:hypothetical protein [Pseudomonadota bacterium]